MQSRRTRRQYIALVAIIAVSLFLVSSAVKCSKEPQPPPRTQEEIELDNIVNSKVRDNLTAASPDVRPADIKVINSIRLNVKLKGQVRSDGERTLVIKITRDTEVVKDGTTHKVKEVDAKELTVKPQ